jgi:hypothetical protein
LQQNLPCATFVRRNKPSSPGTIRREFLDHTLIWNAVDLERKLEEFRTYYNEHRVHQSLNGRTPGERSGQPPPARAGVATTLGGTIAVVCSKCRSRRDLRIRQGHAGAIKVAAGRATRERRSSSKAAMELTRPALSSRIIG